MNSGTLRTITVFLAMGLLACGAPQAPAAPASAPKPAPNTAAPAPPQAVPAAQSAAAAAPAPGRQPLSPRVALRYGDFGGASDSGFYLALDRGYFADEGIDVEAVSISSGGRMVPALGAGQIEVGGGGISAALVNAISRDVPLKMVADKGSLRVGFSYESVLARTDLTSSGAVRTMSDLKGRKVALNSTTSMDIYLLNAALQHGGLRLEDVTLEEIPQTDMVAALANASIDAVIAVEPGATAIIRQGIGTKVLSLDESTPDAQVGVIMYAPHFMSGQPEVARRWMIAYLRGVRDYNKAFTTGERRDELVETLTKHTAIKDPAILNAIVPPGLNPNGYMNVESIMATQEFWRARDLLQTTLPVERMVDHSYVDHALGVLGRQ
jgi:NitT/TauT family transport system substrate-binding protein